MNRLQLYFRLVRLDKPIGIVLLLWPTLAALWLASNGRPGWKLVLIFTLGTILMRSAGCAINDYADQDLDRHVKRTAQRPLTSGKIHAWEALMVAAILALLALMLIFSLNRFTQQLSIIAVLVAASYPYFKRFFAIPQAYLGIAFGFGIPMAFAAVTGSLPAAAWYLLLANIFWAIAYDTEYAMVDRDDDLKMNVKSSAITFGRHDVTIVMLCYLLCFGLIFMVGWKLGLRAWFVAGLLAGIACAIYHYFLIRGRERQRCFAAFRHNNWLGAMVFAGIVFDYAFRQVPPTLHF